MLPDEFGLAVAFNLVVCLELGRGPADVRERPCGSRRKGTDRQAGRRGREENSSVILYWLPAGRLAGKAKQWEASKTPSRI